MVTPPLHLALRAILHVPDVWPPFHSMHVVDAPTPARLSSPGLLAVQSNKRRQLSHASAPPGGSADDFREARRAVARSASEQGSVSQA